MFNGLIAGFLIAVWIISIYKFIEAKKYNKNLDEILDVFDTMEQDADGRAQDYIRRRQAGSSPQSLNMDIRDRMLILNEETKDVKSNLRALQVLYEMKALNKRLKHSSVEELEMINFMDVTLIDKIDEIKKNTKVNFI